ncbi:orexin receptor type 2-like [Saccostrea cucullata]|uniref:orexin receptor type 2-like n=1 Tax=Saccostrea cuccullata TaxID=36930 RepID=UPI002ECFD421
MAESLDTLNDEMASSFSPLIAVLALFLIFGTFGNMVVLFVYGNNTKKFSSDYFIICLSMHDLLITIIGIPTEILDLRYPIIFSLVSVCKVLKGLQGASLMTSSTILLSITLDRYKRICKFGRTMRKRTTKLLCILSYVILIVTAIPVFIVYGKKTVRLESINSTGSACSVADEFRNSSAILIYYGFLIIYFICCIIIFVTVYTLIRYRIKTSFASLSQTRKKCSQMFTVTYAVPQGSTSDIDLPQDSNSGIMINSTPSQSDTHDNRNLKKDSRSSTGNVQQETNIDGKKDHYTAKKLARRQNHRLFRDKSNKTTLIFAYITVGFVLSFLPFLISVIVRAAKSDLEESISTEMNVFFKFCLKSYFLSSVINPLIYGFSSPRFRHECRRALKKCL